MAKDKKKFKGGREKKGLNIVFAQNHVDFFHLVAAESENRLQDYYVPNRFFNSADDFESKKSFFVGRTGIGKTAILKRLKEKLDPNVVLTINPEDFAFTIMERSEILKQLTSSGVNLDLFYKTMWKYIFITEILKKRFGSERKHWLTKQIDKFIDKPAAKAYRFLLKNHEIGEGQTFSEQVAAIVKEMEHNIGAEYQKAGLKLSYSGTFSPEEKRLVQNALTGFEFSELNQFIKTLDEEVLKNHSFVILVDDLDKNWIQNSVGIGFTKCLFETIFEFNSTSRLRLLVSLRTNLFNQLRFHQTEKFLPFIEKIHWTDSELKTILEKRFQVYFPLTGPDIWKYVFPDAVTVDSGRSFDFFDYILGRTNRRPRDILVFIGYMLKHSLGKNVVSADAVRAAEREYSIDRLNALFEEWQNPFLNLDFIREYFAGCSHKMDRSSFFKILDNITEDLLIKDERGRLNDLQWIVEGQYIDKDTLNNDQLFKLLYRIGFIGWKPFGDSKRNFSFYPGQEEANDVIGDGARFYVNPCYYSALHVQFSP